MSSRVRRAQLSQRASGKHKAGERIKRRAAMERRQMRSNRDKRVPSTSRSHMNKSKANQGQLQSFEDEQYDQGFAYGYAVGLRDGQEQYGARIEGTSIIIPTYNKLELLRDCIESIQAHTPNQHEIIVVDNASADGTLSYLQSMTGKLRFHINESNRGFAGAVNTGLMMAKGQSICILNNDTLVTPNWLTNLLACLNSDANIGIVGPVTNYISGDQQIEVPYREMNQMWRFAARHNKSNSLSWEYTERIVGFCYVFHRSFFESTGYLDEGYEIGNFEDEDYIIRAKLGGRKLIIARDTFIHHHGSQSMKALGSQFQEVNDRNASFFSAKWADPYEWIQRIRRSTINERGETVLHYKLQHLYPTHVAVTGLSECIYWIEHGVKYPLNGAVHIPVVRLSQIDLLGYPTGSAMSAAEAAAKWNLKTQSDGGIADGAVFQTESGRFYQRQGEVCREWMTLRALASWKQDGKVIPRTEQDRKMWGEGLPIMAAPVIRSHHI